MMVLQSLLCRVMWPNSGVERFLSVHETFDLAPYIIIGFVLLVGNAELSREFVFESFHPFFFLPQPGVSKSHLEEDGYDKRFVKLELGMGADIALPYHFQTGHR